MALHHIVRRLWDMPYVKAGCEAKPPEDTNYDNAAGTWFTNYVIGAIGVYGATMVLKNNSSDSLIKAFALMFFLGNAFGYPLAGVLHQFLHTNAESDGQMHWWIISYMLTLVGSLGICLIAVNTGSCLSPMLQKIFYGLAVVFYVVAIAYIAMGGGIGAAGAAHGLGFICVAIAYGIRKEILPLCGCVFMIAGLLVQLLLASACGNPGYEVCWKDCILPAPTFNHNALFHVLFAVGMLIMAISLPRQLSESYTKVAQDSGEDEFARGLK